MKKIYLFIFTIYNCNNFVNISFTKPMQFYGKANKYYYSKYSPNLYLLCVIIKCRCFKREFPEAVVLRMWEACWSNYLTDHFHLFLCAAIVSAYAEDVVAQDLRADEMLLHFSSLAMFMDGDLILRKVLFMSYGLSFHRVLCI